MKRHPNGINLDDGVELWTEEDFERLYVPARPEMERRLKDWLVDPRAEALIFSGQIGSGKTTLLNKVLRDTTVRPMVRVEFDQLPLDETPGAFLAVLFGVLLKEALTIDCSCEGLPVSLSDFEPFIPDTWENLKDCLLEAHPEIAGVRRLRSYYSVFDENLEQTKNACAELIYRINQATGSSPPIIAEGVDKFDLSRAGYIGLVEILDFLRDYRTLFEANAIHLFDAGRKWVGADKLFVGPFEEGTMAAMFDKRLGDYAPLYRKEISRLIPYGGGNARQALRLLNSYYYFRSGGGKDRQAALALAAHQVTQDLLQFGFDRFPADLLAIFKRDGYVEAGVLTSPNTSRDAILILYRNWVFLQSTPGRKSTRWPLSMNPLIADTITWEQEEPEPPELKAVRSWARDLEISPFGLSHPEDEAEKTRTWQETWEILSSGDSFFRLNIVGLIEEIASSLFSTNRQDRIMVSYRDPGNLQAALDYLIGKASTYGPFNSREIHLVGGEGEDPVSVIMAEIKGNEQSTIFVIYMEGKWTPNQLNALERLRDRFIDAQMLWFVEHGALMTYLRHWTQFRQLLRFYVLEDDFLGSLSREEIEEDLSLLSSLAGDDDSGVHHLKQVLRYLETRLDP